MCKTIGCAKNNRMSKKHALDQALKDEFKNVVCIVSSWRVLIKNLQLIQDFISQCAPWKSNGNTKFYWWIYSCFSASFIRSRPKVGAEHKGSIWLKPETGRVKENNPNWIKPQISCLLRGSLFNMILGHIHLVLSKGEKKPVIVQKLIK